ncbi:response regulator receiver modulated metal dependent phosphohydrolase [Thermotoga sp. Mc24]|uniref:cyclic di-GMP phosphodiesterase n=1 Tax=Thermotoga sp. Mc24 TaxID=1231241 RepID=UPI000542E29F|nr:cyclic di-GMP phosphodiesterase [Thermotoga sp. Mc24]KHC93342.1 response regulator receiver modulated metal dependent phosphohydrolase [Thermotoga sp. Mc24]
MTVLIVEDDDITREAMGQYLKLSGIDVIEAENGEKAVELSKDVDVALVDVMLPGMSGIEVVNKIKAKNPSCVVFVVTAYDDTGIIKKCVEVGTDDFIKKPVNLELLRLKITHALRNRVFHLYRNSYLKSLKKKLFLLEKTAEEFFTEYEDFLFEVLEILNMLSEYRDMETHKHTERVGWLSGRIAEEMGMSEVFVTEIQFAAPLHDIGKIGIPDRILLKPGILTPEEFEIMKQHTTIGFRILSRSNSPILQLGAEIALTHHERWNGAGYPRGLKGREIPISGLIVAVADSFDAMVSKRPYKNPKPLEEAFREIESLSGKLYSPEVVEAFLKLEKEITDVYRREKDEDTSNNGRRSHQSSSGEGVEGIR